MATIKDKFPTLSKKRYVGPSASTPVIKSRNQIHGDKKEVEEEEEAKQTADLSTWNLYPSLVKWYQERSIKLMDWQRDCLNKPGVLEGRNLVFAAPTSAGKTMISDILLFKYVFNPETASKKVLVILPFVAIVREKMLTLKDMLGRTHIRVEGFHGNRQTPGGFDAANVCVCTVEKANLYILRLFERNQLDEVGMIIVDEIHLINDHSRGYRLELLLSKVLMARKQQNLPIQIIGMSADIQNLEDLAKWLDAVHYSTRERPVVLRELLLCEIEGGGHDVYERRGEEKVKKDTLSQGPIMKYSRQTLTEDPPAGELQHSLLIFYNNKAGLETLAKNIAHKITSTVIPPKQTQELLDKLQNCSVRVDDQLIFVAKKGVGMHHADMAVEHKDLIEEAFRGGSIRVLVSTSTLSSGVNLPAKRVIVKSPNFGGRMMDILTYRQMIGRAGRKGFHTEGESILMCSCDEVKNGEVLFLSPSPPISSSLIVKTGNKLGNSEFRSDFDQNILLAGIMEAIVTKIANTTQDLSLFLESTFFAAQATQEDKDLLRNEMNRALLLLLKLGLLEATDLQREQQIIPDTLIPETILFGIVFSGMKPFTGISKIQEVKDTLNNFVMGGDLALLYFIIQDDAVRSLKPSVEKLRGWMMDWSDQDDSRKQRKTQLLAELRNQQLEVAKIAGLKMGVVMKMTLKDLQETSHKKFFVALALHEIIEEGDLNTVCFKYDIPKGVLQGLQQTAASLSSMVATLCDYCGWKQLKVVFNDLVSRLEFGVGSELFDLMEIPSMTPKLARTLFKYGLFKPSHVASEKKLGGVWKSVSSDFNGNRTIELRNKRTGQLQHLSLTQVKELLVKEAKELLEEDIRDKNEILSQSSTYSITQTPIMASREPRHQLNIGSRTSVFDSPEKTPFNSQDDSHVFTIPRTPLDEPIPKIFETLLEDTQLDESNNDHDQEITCFPALAQVDKSLAESKRKYFPPQNNIRDNNKRPRSIYSDAVKTVFAIESKGENVAIQPVKSDKDVLNLFSLWSFFGTASMSTVVTRNSGDVDNITVGTRNLFLDKIIMCFGDSEVFSIEGSDMLRRFGNAFNDQLRARIQQFDLIVYDLSQVFLVLYKALSVERKILFETIVWIDLKIRMWMKSNEVGEELFPYSFSSGKCDCLQQLVDTVCPDYNTLAKSLEEPDQSAAVLTVLLFPLWRGMIWDKELMHIIEDVETPASLVFAEIQSTGLLVDRERLSHLKRTLHSTTKKLQLLAQSLTAREKEPGKKIVLDDIVSVRNVLYHHLKLHQKVQDGDDIHPTPKGSHPLTTNKQRLMTLGKYHQLPRTIIDYRKLSWSCSRSVDLVSLAYKESVDESKTGRRLYGQLEVWTATGRISMSDPPLLMTPRNFTVTTGIEDDPNEPAETIDIRIRAIFVPAPGFIFLSSDFSQIELRILAHFSKDQRLLHILNKGCDVFRELSSIVFQKRSLDISDDERNRVKRFCYAIIYGMQSSRDYDSDIRNQDGDNGNVTKGTVEYLDEMEIEEEELIDFNSFRDVFFTNFPDVDKFRRETEIDCKERGYVETLCGRRRYLPLIKSNVEPLQARAKRQALNTKIQGSAADLMKLAITRIHREMIRRDLFSRARLVHTMHDELIFEVNTLFLNEFASFIRDEMSSVGDMLKEPMSVHLPVNVKKGSDWSNMSTLLSFQ